MKIIATKNAKGKWFITRTFKMLIKDVYGKNATDIEFSLVWFVIDFTRDYGGGFDGGEPSNLEKEGVIGKMNARYDVGETSLGEGDVEFRYEPDATRESVKKRKIVRND